MAVVFVIPKGIVRRRYEGCDCGCGERFPRRHMVTIPAPAPGFPAERIYFRHAMEAGIAIYPLIKRRV